MVPFAATETARRAANDPRPSLAARYADDTAYVAAVRQEAARQQAERLLLEEDAIRSIDAARLGRLAKLAP